MLPFRHRFKNYRSIPPRAITAANKRTFYAIGTGDLQVDVPNGNATTQVLLRDTLHAPEMALTIISIGRITSAGHSVTFEPKSCKIKNPAGKLIGNIPASSNGLYKVEHAYFAANTSPVERVDIHTLHRRLGHISATAIRSLVRHHAISGIELIDHGSPIICDSCEYAKMTRKVILKERVAPPAKRFGDEIHTDLWGPSPVNSLGGRRYYITFTDDATRYTHVDILRTKDEALDAYKTFAAWAQTQHGVKIKALRSDRGGEYTGHKFTKFLQQEGTERRLTTHDTPQHNGVAESLNRRILERVRAMLHHSGLPKNLWAEAVRHAVWLKNRSSTRALGNDTTPYERLYGNKPDLSSIPPWGQTSWVHSSTGSKLDARGVEADGSDSTLKVLTHIACTGLKSGPYPSNATSSLTPPTTFSTQRITLHCHKLKHQALRPHLPHLLHHQHAATSAASTTSSPSATSTTSWSSSATGHTSAVSAPILAHTFNPLLAVLVVVARVLQQCPVGCNLKHPTRPRPPPHPPSRGKGKAPQEPNAGQHASRNSQQKNGPSSVEKAPLERSLMNLLSEAARRWAHPDYPHHYDSGALRLPIFLSPISLTSQIARNSSRHPSLNSQDDPKTLTQARSRSDWPKWQSAMDREIATLEKAGTWSTVTRPANKNIVGSKWVFRIKRKADGTIEKYKARLVAQGFTQKFGVDYFDTFSPVAQAFQLSHHSRHRRPQRLGRRHFDFNGAYLNGELDDNEEIYMKPPPGYTSEGEQVKRDSNHSMASSRLGANGTTHCPAPLQT
jgi:hypothetical protein